MRAHIYVVRKQIVFADPTVNLDLPCALWISCPHAYFNVHDCRIIHLWHFPYDFPLCCLHPAAGTTLADVKHTNESLQKY
jgi:hypothetical protein